MRILKLTLSVILFVGILGSILFFPFNFNDHYTCIYHRIVFNENPVQKPLTHSTDIGEMKESDERNSGSHVHHAHEQNSMEFHYLRYFAFLWWTSLLMVFGSIWIIIRIKKSHLQPGSELKIASKLS